MRIRIHRGTREIGGSCVEVRTATTVVVLDIGMPLVERDGSDFDFGKYKGLGTEALVREGVLPDIPGLYGGTAPGVDAVLLSHPHLDHYGFGGFLHPGIPIHMGVATEALIRIGNIFTPQRIEPGTVIHFEKSHPFTVGDIRITPFWMDHSAFDAYAFLLEASGRTLFYSGDFRRHGRKAKVFDHFLRHAPKEVDCLLMEGTQVDRGTVSNRTEAEIEEDLADLFGRRDGIDLVYTAGQNIDRLVSIYRACLRSGSTLVVDLYIAAILETLSEFAALPHPSRDYRQLKVFHPYFTCRRLKREGHLSDLYRFKDFKITREQIEARRDEVVMTVRPSMQSDLDRMRTIDGGHLVYSMWGGYKVKSGTGAFLDYLAGRGFDAVDIHTSGHADLEALRAMAAAIAKPRHEWK